MQELFSASTVSRNYAFAKEVYQAFGVDTDQVLTQMKQIPISLHCWQGDDVSGFEVDVAGVSGGGILATGNYPGRARNGAELRQDLEKALSLIPGRHRINLHAMYAETGGKFVERDELTIEHFTEWVQWAKRNGLGLDFNPTFFSHKMADSGFTLSSKDPEVRSFWVRHAQRCREIAAAMGKELGTPCINNVWIPDGSKDLPADRLVHREILRDALDEVFGAEYDRHYLRDAVESKLFGLASESYVVGSHEFYMAYALTRDVMVCLDAGHFHPTEGIADKISALLAFSDEILLHVSRGVRWDSDHVVITNDDLLAIAHEIKRCNALSKVYVALDFFDASINRIAAWAIGARATLRALLTALLEPTQLLRDEENKGNLGNRLALMEEFKTLPVAAVWRKYCLDNDVPVGIGWLDEVRTYEETVLRKRS